MRKKQKMIYLFSPLPFCADRTIKKDNGVSIKAAGVEGFNTELLDGDPARCS